jgi:hypothetical protein|tara:strand:+ start:155 stop:343 length:189 start_codon:yes stop_codon:yes gene_type:complete
MTAIIYNFSDYVKKKKESLRVSYGFHEEVWALIEESGYDIYDPEDIDQFFYDLGEEEEEDDG